MKKPLVAALAVVALIGAFLLPAPASANITIYACEARNVTPSPEWFGVIWSAPIKVRLDTDAKTIDLLDKDDNVITGTYSPYRLGMLNNHQIDITIDENVIRWGIVQMWGFSGYIDRRSGQLDMLWTKEIGQQQFHGICRVR